MDNTAIADIMGISGVIDLAGLGANTSNKLKVAASKKLKSSLQKEALTRTQKLLLSMADEMDVDTREAIARNNVRVGDLQHYVSRYVASTGPVNPDSTLPLLKESSDQIAGITTFQKNQLPQGMNSLITAVGVEVGCAAVSTFAARAGMAYDAEAAPALISYDSTALLTSELITNNLLNPVRRYALPEVLMNCILEIRFANKLVYSEEIRNLTNSGGSYSAARGLFDMRALQNPLLLKGKTRVSIDLKFPNKGKWGQIDETPGLALNLVDGHYFVKIRLNSTTLFVTE